MYRLCVRCAQHSSEIVVRIPLNTQLVLSTMLAVQHSMTVLLTIVAGFSLGFMAGFAFAKYCATTATRASKKSESPKQVVVL